MIEATVEDLRLRRRDFRAFVFLLLFALRFVVLRAALRLRRVFILREPFLAALFRLRFTILVSSVV